MSFDSFLREKQYLENVSPNTLRWYKHALKWLPAEHPDERQLKDMVVRMREQGLKATGCNAALRAISCYLHWDSQTAGKCGSGCKHPRVSKLKEPEQIMPTFSAEQVKLLLGFKPTTDFERRLHLLVMVLFDTGCRISEALEIRIPDIDLDNLLLTLHGKGRKDRRVPYSFELRKALFKHTEKKQGLLFVTANVTRWGRMGALRAVKIHCRNLGFEAPARTLHSCRHTFATSAIARGMHPFVLQRILGHTTMVQTNKYVHLSVQDLQQGHISLLR